MKKQNLTEILSLIRPVQPPAGLFDHIILTIQKEQTKRAFLRFLSCLAVSLIAVPVSGAILTSQIANSGIYYFLSVAINDLSTFFILWQDFSLALLETLPLVGMMIFLTSLIISIFILKLFFCRKKLLLNYLKP